MNHFLALSSTSSFKEFIDLLLGFVNSILFLLVGAALLVFFKGLTSFISKAGDAQNHEDGKNLMIWGVVGIFVMVAVFGILRFFYSDFGFTHPFGLPLLPTS